MKTRSDFVSNSSSSSFVVLDEGDVPQLFKGRRVTFDEIAQEHFDVLDFDEIAYSRRWLRPRSKSSPFKTVPDADFGRMFASMELPDRTCSVPESQAEAIPAMTRALAKWLTLNDISCPDKMHPSIVSSWWSAVRWDMADAAEREFDEAAAPARARAFELARAEMSRHMFWMAELGDDSDEDAGYREIKKLAVWHHVRSHH